MSAPVSHHPTAEPLRTRGYDGVATHRYGALTRPGTVFGLFLLFYGAFRSVVEFVREPHAGHPMDVGIFTPGIVYSIPMILVGAWLIWRARRQPALAA